MFRLRAWPIALACLLVTGCVIAEATDDAPKQAAPASQNKAPHRDWALTLVRDVQLENTSYRHKDNAVHWKGVGGAKEAVCHTDCSGFVNALLKQSYGLTDDSLRDWLGARRPLAKSYYSAIVEQRRFKRIKEFGQVQAGDFIAIQYAADDPENTDHNTGHILLVVNTPKKRISSSPNIKDTDQWLVPVIDQSRSGHGNTDSRHKKDGGFAAGLGQGEFRVYTNADGSVAGHTWSLSARSKYRSQSARPLAIGRVLVDNPKTK